MDAARFRINVFKEKGNFGSLTPLIRLVNQIIVEAFKMRASDIHVEPLSKGFRMRYRIDGVIQSQVGNKLIDLRVACLPTHQDKSIVMRISDKEWLRLCIGEL